jgi:hypothetical protein
MFLAAEMIGWLIQVKDDRRRPGIMLREQESRHASRFDICRRRRHQHVRCVCRCPHLG